MIRIENVTILKVMPFFYFIGNYSVMFQQFSLCIIFPSLTYIHN